MTPPATATATAAARRSASRTTARGVAPRVPRRVSGPLRPALGAGARALPAGRPLRHARAHRDRRVLDGLLRGRAWIWLVGVLLGGIVAMQVSLLKLNTGISRAVEATSTYERQNAELEVIVSRLSSRDRITEAAGGLGLVLPDAGSIGFLTSRGEFDSRRAARRISPPSPEAFALLRNRGRVGDPIIQASTLTAAPMSEAAAVAAPAPAASVPVQQPIAARPAPAADPAASQAGGASAGTP